MRRATITYGRNVPVRAFGLVAALLAQFMLVLDASAVTVALPAIKRDLAVSPGQVPWIAGAYLIAFGGLLLVFGRLGDQLGRRRILGLGITGFTLASIACGVAPGAVALIGARFVQGAGAAAAAAMILAIIATEFPRRDERAKAMSAYMFVSVTGGSVGLFVGGLVTQALGWHWIFWGHVPIGALSLWLVRRHVRPRVGAREPLDVAGGVLVTLATMVAIYALVEAGHRSWTVPAVRIATALAIVLGVLFFAVESQRRHPVLPLRVLRIRSLVVTSVVGGLMALGLYAAFFMASLDMADAHVGPLRVGLAFLPQTLAVGALSLGGSAYLVRRFGAVRVLVAGLAILAVAIGGLAMAPSLRALADVLLGLGLGMAFLPLLTLAMSEVPAADAGLGSAIVTLSFQLADAAVHGHRFAYTVALVGVMLGLTLAATLLARPGYLGAERPIV